MDRRIAVNINLVMNDAESIVNEAVSDTKSPSMLDPADTRRNNTSRKEFEYSRASQDHNRNIFQQMGQQQSQNNKQLPSVTRFESPEEKQDQILRRFR